MRADTLDPWQSRPASPSNQRFGKSATIVLIGARGVGKSTVAEIAAQALQWQVIEVDEAVRFASTYHPESSSSSSSSPPAVARPDVLDDILTHRRFEKIVVCDVADLQHPSSRDLIQRFGSEVGPVVHVTRNRESVWHESLASGRVHEEHRDDWLRSWEACEEMCRSICSYEFVSLDCRVRRDVASGDGDGDGGSANGNGNYPPFKSIERDFTRLLRFIIGIDTNHIYVGPTAPQSYFLALTYDDVSLAIPHLDDLSIGIDCFEIRADLLKSYDLTFLAHQVAILRAATDLPILFTMRTHSQGGSFPDPRRDPAVAKRYNDVNKLAIKLGVEYLDVELFSPPGTIQEVMQIKGNTKIILSWHDWTGKVSWLGNEVKQIYEVACREGADVVKMIGWARSFQDNLNLRQFAQAVQQRGKVPLLAVNMGVEGKMSRILNRHLTPVSHPLMPQPSAPGQISFSESQQVLFLTGLLQAQDFYLLGHHLSASYSPVMHTAAFQALGLPHKYHLAESDRVDSYYDVLNSPSFGGASVTNPHKLTIMPFLRRVSSHAHAIGAVNTIINTQNGLVGDNTDWRAIRASVQKAMSPAHAVSAETTALVYGAGGAARAAVYALFQIGVLNVYIWNRTRERAETLVADLSRLSPALRILRLSSGDLVELAHTPHPPQIIISTLPSMPAVELSLCPMPRNLLAADGGVVLELNFAEDDSPLLSMARQTPGWVGVPGLEVLLEQGYEQLRAWTARRAPRKAMRLAALEERERRRRARQDAV